MHTVMCMGLKGQDKLDELGWRYECVMPVLVYGGGNDDGMGDTFEQLFSAS